MVRRETEVPSFSEENQKRLSRFIENHSGIKMPESKRQLLVNRLSKRVTNLGFQSFDQYCDFLFETEKGKGEIVELMNAVSTNKTEFFREIRTFDVLVDQAIPDLLRNRGSSENWKIWSAACSTGEEPYTIAMVLEKSLPDGGPDYEILGTDLSTRALQKALDGIYSQQQLDQVPEEYRDLFFLKSRNPGKNLVRVVPELRRRAVFRRLNLKDQAYDVRREFDFIFCRNVLIYFDQPTKETIVRRLSGYLRKGGYFVIGNSESLLGMEAGMKNIHPGVYKKF